MGVVPSSSVGSQSSECAVHHDARGSITVFLLIKFFIIAFTGADCFGSLVVGPTSVIGRIGHSSCRLR